MKAADEIVREVWGKKVRNARVKLELSQTAAAERCGCDQSTISRIENGDYRQMTPEVVLRLCLGLRMDINDAFAWPAAIVEIAEMRAEADAGSAA